MIEFFNIGNVNGAASTFNTQKLIWLNEQYIKTLPVEEIIKHLQWHIDNQNLKISDGPDLSDVIEAHRDRAKTLKELVATIRYYYEDFTDFDEKAAKKHFKTATPSILQHLLGKLALLESWQAEEVDKVIKICCEELELGMGKVGPALRVAVTGSAVSPSLEITLALIGKEKTLERLEKAIVFATTKYAE